jgi:hypothetical protein
MGLAWKSTRAWRHAFAEKFNKQKKKPLAELTTKKLLINSQEYDSKFSQIGQVWSAIFSKKYSKSMT